MNVDDVVYLCLLLASIGFGHVYRRIEHFETKKWVGTAVGGAVIVAVSGWHTLHPLFLTAVNVAILQFVSQR